MRLQEGQVIAIYAIMQQGAGGTHLGIGWTGPGLGSDITKPTLIGDWVSHVHHYARRARLPSPAPDAHDVPLDSTLGWAPGDEAVLHDVYLGTDPQSVEAASRSNGMGVLRSGSQDANALDTSGLLALDGVYYWRIDEVTDQGTVTPGVIWSFQTEPSGYPLASGSIIATASSAQPGCGPEKTINGSGLDEQDGHSTAAVDMWQSAVGAQDPVWIQYEFDRIYKLHEILVWNYNGDIEFLVGFGLERATIETSLDGRTWTTHGQYEFGRGSSVAGYAYNTAIPLAGTLARQVRVTVNSTFGAFGQCGLSEVRFLYIPTRARAPQPSPGATHTTTEPTLTRRPGRDAISHEVHFGTDERAVAEVWVEAEGADSLASIMQVHSDREDASGGLYIGTYLDSSSSTPPEDGVAGFTLMLEKGAYQIIGRVAVSTKANGDSFWVRLSGAATNTVNHESGWVRWGFASSHNWFDTPVRSMDDGDQTVSFSVESAGFYNLEIAYREAGAMLDRLKFTRQSE